MTGENNLNLLSYCLSESHSGDPPSQYTPTVNFVQMKKKLLHKGIEIQRCHRHQLSLKTALHSAVYHKYISLPNI